MPDNSHSTYHYDVQDIMQRTPAWITRWGITIFFVSLLVIAGGSWFIHYPDIIRSPVVITTENPPAPVIARASGKIENLMVTEGQLVEPGQRLGNIKNPASYEDVNYLKEYLDLLGQTPDFVNENQLHSPSKNVSLGEIQPEYATFLKNLTNLQQYFQLDYYTKKITALREELVEQQEYTSKLNRQAAILEQEYALVHKQYSRDSILFSKQVIPESEYERSKTENLRKLFEIEQAESAVSQNHIIVIRLKQQLLDLKLKGNEQEQALKRELTEAYESLKSAVASWDQKYLLIAPVRGRVTFNSFWSINQSVSEGDRVLTVIPLDEGSLIGKMEVSMRGAGKVKTGQRVNLRLDNFPYMEFGMVQGVIKSISLVPEHDAYTVEVKLPESLKTSYGIRINFSQQMKGTAEIITEDLRLPQRIINPLRSIIKTHVNTER